MEKKLQADQAKNTHIKALSAALQAGGVLEGSEVYYEDKDYKCPFFKIPKAYLREKATDPEVHYIFIDVEEVGSGQVEYTVVGNFVHEHVDDAKKAVRLVKGLLSEELVEVALVMHGVKASFLMPHTGDHEKNISFLAADKEAVEYVLGQMQNPVVKKGDAHLHAIWGKIAPQYLMCEKATGMHILKGINTYMVSAIFGRHPEYYVME